MGMCKDITGQSTDILIIKAAIQSYWDHIPGKCSLHFKWMGGGRCSDKFIIDNSGILNKLIPGDTILADRGLILTNQLVRTVQL